MLIVVVFLLRASPFHPLSYTVTSQKIVYVFPYFCSGGYERTQAYNTIIMCNVGEYKVLFRIFGHSAVFFCVMFTILLGFDHGDKNGVSESS